MINLIETNEKEKINSFLERINANILKEIFNNRLFLSCFTNYLSKKENFDVDVVCDKLKSEFDMRDIINTCRICDILNLNTTGYLPIIKEYSFNFSYNFNSICGNNGIRHFVVMDSNYFNVKDFLYDKIKHCSTSENIGIDIVEVKNVKKSDEMSLAPEQILNYLNLGVNRLKIIGNEDDLNMILNLYELANKSFEEVAECYYLVKSLDFIVSLLSYEIKNAYIINLVRRTSDFSQCDKETIENFIEKTRIYKIGQIKNIDYREINVNCLRLLLKLLVLNDLNSPKDIQNNLIAVLKDREQDIAELRFRSGLKYQEIGDKIGITRAGAQSAMVKILQRLSNPYRFAKLYNLLRQVLLFRENDYFITSDIFNKLSIWRYLLPEVFGLYDYKNLGIYVIEDYVDDMGFQVFLEKYPEFDKNEEKIYEFDFVGNLPSIIRKNDLDKYLNFAIENSRHYISHKDLKKIISLNYIDYNTVISKNKLSISYFMKYILKTYFPNGLDVYDRNNINKVKELLSNLFNYSTEEYSDRYITHRICMISTLGGRGVWKYSEESIEISDDLKCEIVEYIQNYPISAVPIKTVFEKFEKQLINEGIENKYIFQGLIKKVVNNNYKTTKDYIYTDDSQTYVEIIANYIKNSKVLVTKELLEKEFPGFSMTSMQRIINTSPVVNMNGYFAYMDNLDIQDADKEKLKDELEGIVGDGESHNAKNIFIRFKSKFNGLFNRVGITHYLQFYYIINKLFENDFEFLRPFIAKKGVEIQDKETQLIELIVQEKRITIEKLRDLSVQVGYFMESIMDLVIRNNDKILFYDENTIVAIDEIHIDEEKMLNLDGILDSFMLYSNYRYLSELADYHEIKELFGPTNKWMLYSIVSAFSTKYKIFRTSNVMSRTELIIAMEGFDFNSVKESITKTQSDYNLEDLLDLEDLQ